MRLVRFFLMAMVMMLLVMSFAVWGLVRADFFWRWAGGRAVALVQTHLKGRLTVGEIRGNLFDGLVFQDISLSTPEEELFRTQSLEIRLSWWSLVELKPVFGRLALVKPFLKLRQDQAGRWNVADLLRSAGEPDTPPETSRGWLAVIRSVKFRQIVLIDGELHLSRPGETRQVQNLDLELALKVDKPLGPEPTFTVSRLTAGVPGPSGRLVVSGQGTYGKNMVEVPRMEIKTGDRTLLCLSGKADVREGGEIALKGNAALSSRELRPFWRQWPEQGEAAVALSVQGTVSQVRLTLSARVREATVEAAGTLGRTGEIWEYDLSGEAKNLTADFLGLYDPGLVEKAGPAGPLGFTFRFQGTGFSFPPARMSWKVEGGPWQHGGVKVDQVRLSLSGDQETQEFQGTVRSSVGKLSLRAAGSLLAAGRGHFSLQVESLNPGPLGLDVPQRTQVSGKVDGTFTSPGGHTLKGLKLTANLEAGGRLGPHPLKARGRLVWEPNALQLSQSTVQAGNLTAEFQGSLTGEALNFTHRGSSGTGGAWPIPAQVGGRFSWEGTLRGSLDDPQIALQAKGRGLSYEKFKLQNFTMNARTRGLPPSQGEVALQAAGVQTPTGAFSQVALGPTATTSSGPLT